MTLVKKIVKILTSTILALTLRYVIKCRHAKLLKSIQRKFIILQGVFNPEAGYTTYLMLKTCIEVIKKLNKRLRVVETCAGTGLIGVVLASSFRRHHVVLVDVDKKCVKNCLLNTRLNRCDSLIDVVQCSLVSCFREHSVDIVIANIPYLSCPYDVDVALCGGVNLELLSELVSQAYRTLRQDGLLVVATSSLSTLSPRCSIRRSWWLILDHVYINVCTWEELLRCLR